MKQIFHIIASIISFSWLKIPDELGFFLNNSLKTVKLFALQKDITLNYFHKAKKENHVHV